MFDAIVVGGGPAGSVFASLVKRADPSRRVLVLEKERFPRHHVGESLIAGIAPVLARAGLLSKLEALAESPSGVLRKAGITYWWGENEDSHANNGWTTDFRDPETGRPVIGTYQVDRAAFDHLLLGHAREQGAEVVEGARVTSVQRSKTWRVSYELEGREKSAESPLVVDASGLSRIMARATGTSVEPFDEMSNYAIYGYWEGSYAHAEGAPTTERERWTFISTTELGWVWHIPLEGSRASVGLVTSKEVLRDAVDIESLYRSQVRKAERTWALLESATLDSELRVVRDWSSALSTTCGEGWLAIGDAAGFVDPILTSGMLLAISGAGLAASFAQTLWTTDADEVLLRTSYDETLRDLLTAYHRLAGIWYGRNDKVHSWWWEARQQALRASPTSDDRRAFLAASLGLARDPHAAAATVGFEPVRPDKELFAHHLFEDGEAVDRTLGQQLTRLVAFDGGERDARGAVHGRLMQRWRGLLDAEVSLVALDVIERERYYCDRTMPRWELGRFVELKQSGAFLDRVVLDDTPLVELLARPGTLRARLEAQVQPGSTESRDALRGLWRDLVQLDMRDWLAGEVQIGSDPRALEMRVREFAPNVHAFEVGLLGRTLTLHLSDAPTLDIVFAPVERAWKRTDAAAFSYRGELFATEVLDAIVAQIRASDAERLRGAEGYCVELRDEGFVAVAPDQISARRGQISARRGRENGA